MVAFPLKVELQPGFKDKETMSNFSVNVYEAKIVQHPNADAIEICMIGDYQTIVKKGQFVDGDLVAYIPEAAVLPLPLIIELGLEGKLSGSEKNRVKVMRLRGVVSQGLVYPAKSDWILGQDVTEILGITKYEIPESTIPALLRGECMNVGQHRTIKYDIENFKKYPKLFNETMEVVMTEKCHGTFCGIGLMPDRLSHEGYTIFPFSKGLGADGIAFRWLKEVNKEVAYCKVVTDNLAKLEEVRRIANDNDTPVFILGEAFGNGIQDLSYGFKNGEFTFRVFDVYIGTREYGSFMNDIQLTNFCENFGFTRVPVLYRGPFNKEIMLEHTKGKETISGRGMHVREGVVVRTINEQKSSYEDRFDGAYGRLQLKSVSDDYLFRKGNATEFN